VALRLPERDAVDSGSPDTLIVLWCGMSSAEVKIQAILARPLKIAGRVVLGPRLVGKQYTRIIALANGAGRLEIYDSAAGGWCAAPDSCSFALLWSAAPCTDLRDMPPIQLEAKQRR
jgi:hypothetical protein